MISRWWQLTYFLFFTPDPWGRFESILTNIFFKGVETATTTLDLLVKILQIKFGRKILEIFRGLKASFYGRKSHDIHRRCT